MKRIYNCLLCVSVLAMSSCSSSWLDLDPSTSVTSPDAILTTEDAEIALNGI